MSTIVNMDNTQDFILVKGNKASGVFTSLKINQQFENKIITLPCGKEINRQYFINKGINLHKKICKTCRENLQLEE